MKRTGMKLPGSTIEPFTIQDYSSQHLSAKSALSRKGVQKYLHPEEPVYDQLRDGEALYASLPTEEEELVCHVFTDEEKR